MAASQTDVLVVVDDPWGIPTWLTNMPWWFISAGIHLVILLIATLFYVERLMAIDEGPMTVNVTPRALPQQIAELLKEPDRFADREISAPDASADDETAKDPASFAPAFDIGDHDETNDAMDKNTPKGDSLDAWGFVPGLKDGFRGAFNGPNPGTTDSLGVGPGGGYPGRRGTPDGGGDEDLRTKGPPRALKITEDAVLAALKWLARHQNADGSWGSTFSNQCVGSKCDGSGEADYDTGVTGLALLAFLGGGYTHLSKDTYDDPLVPGRKLRFGLVVKEGLKWLLSRQDPEGCLGPRVSKFMYNHTIAALALCEAYGMTATQNFRGPAQRAIDFLVASQNPGRGWRYSARCGDNDTSVTGWAVMALKSAELADLPFPKSSYDGIRTWLDEATEPTYYRTGYNARGSGIVYEAGRNESFTHHESMSAVAVLSRIFMNKDRRDPALGAAQYLVKDLPAWKQNLVDFYYWYYASLALFQYDGDRGPYWSKWNEKMKEALVPHQKGGRDGCQTGSWNPGEDRWGLSGGRIYAAAINALTLEVYYRYQNVFGGTRK